MGFGGNSRKKAKADQEAALAAQNAAYQNSQNQVNQYNSNFDTRNAPIIGLQTSAQNWLNRYDKGEDIATLNPTAVKSAQMAADQVKNTMQGVNELGTNSFAKGDRGYQSRLNSLSGREISKSLASVNEQGLLDELGNERGILMDTSSFLNSDRQYGLGQTNNLFGMASGMFNSATEKRQMEIQRGNMMNQMLMDGIFGGISGFASAGTGGFSGMAKMFCVHGDSVITLTDGFCIAKKVLKNKPLYKNNNILKIEVAEVREMILVATEHYSIYVTPSHVFSTGIGEIEAGQIEIGQTLETATEWEDVVLIEPVFGKFKVYNFITKDGTYIANCFVCLG